MYSPDRYALALAMLDGDRDARKVLADLLEEQGERGLAQWARQGRNKSENRLDFALMLLPCREAILLGADFLDESLARCYGVGAKERCAATVRCWSEGTATDKQTRFALSQLLRRIELSTTQPHHFGSSDALRQLIRAIECSVSADECSASGDVHKVAHWHAEAKRAIRAVSYNTRRSTSNIPGQIIRTKTLLKKLITA
jgi:hypothetical protein